MTTPAPEAWLRGPIAGIPALCQPAAHALVLAREDVDAAMTGITHDQLWSRPHGITPLGFHLAHLAGSTGRLMRYATGQPLSDAQKEFLAYERGVMDTLADARAIGKAQLPTTVAGAIFHAAEHAARHTGQIVTTAKLVRS